MPRVSGVGGPMGDGRTPLLCLCIKFPLWCAEHCPPTSTAKEITSSVEQAGVGVTHALLGLANPRNVEVQLLLALECLAL